MINKLSPVGQLLYKLGALRAYKDGSSVGILWRWYHPLTWIAVPVLSLVICVVVGGAAVYGEFTTSGHNHGFKVSPYFKRHPEKLEWL